MMNARWSFLAVPLLAALGCSDPVPLPAQGAITVNVRLPSSTSGGSTCPDPGTAYTVGNPLTPATGTLVDGDNSAHISCSVKPGGAGFAFNGSLSATTTTGDPYLITATFSGGSVDSTGAGTTDFSLYTPKLSQTFTSSAPCTVQVINGQVKGGSIWARFSCPSLTNPPSGLCQVGDTDLSTTLNAFSTVILFENCDGS